MPVNRSKDSIEWAAAHDIPIRPGGGSGPPREGTVSYYAACLAARGRRGTPDRPNITVDCYIADSRAQAIEEGAPYLRYFYTLYNFDHVPLNEAGAYYSKTAAEHLRPELRA